MHLSLANIGCQVAQIDGLEVKPGMRRNELAWLSLIDGERGAQDGVTPDDGQETIL
jgi:hypothetical protein